MSLSGIRVLVTRARHQADSLSQELTNLGAEVVEIPLIEITPPDDFAPIDEALRSAPDWLVVTSANAVAVIVDRAAQVGAKLASIRIAAIGTATAQAFEARGVRVDHVPDSAEAESLAGGLGDLRGRRVMLAQADIARPATSASLRTRGAHVDVVTAYRTTAATSSRDDLRRELQRGVDVITFMSGSAVNAFVELGGPDVAGGARLACIGEHTAAAVRAAGLTPHIVATSQTARALAEAIARELRTCA